jgi:VCBS repeat protein
VNLALPTVLVVAFATSCGLGGAGILSGGSGGGGGGSGNAPPVVSDLVVGAGAPDLKTSPVQVSFKLTDAEGDPVGVVLAYLPASGGSPVPMTLVGNPSLSGLASSAAGVTHAFAWDFAAQLPSGASYVVGLNAIVRTASGSSQSLAGPFALGNDAPEILSTQTPPGEVEGVVPVGLVVADSSADLVSIEVEFDDLCDPAGWSPATGLGAPLVDLSATPAGLSVVFLWSTQLDAPGREFRARLRFTPNDGTVSGVAVETSDILVDNNQTPAALVNGSAFFASSDARRGIPLEVRVVDEESDPVRLVFQWKRPGEAFPSLPSDEAAVAAILQDPVLALQHQVASEFETFREGAIVPLDAAHVRLPELATDAAGLQATGLVGQELELVRPASRLASPLGAWSTNTLSAPVAALPCDHGEHALVLDTPVLGTWRLRDIDLASGSVLASLVASAAGTPTALAERAERQEVLVAHETGGVWRIDAVDRTTGAVTALAAASGATGFGPVRGLVSTSADTALITVGVRLVAIDWSAPSAPTETSLAADLQAPWGLARDPLRSQHVYVAERDWVNPATSQVEGRIVDFHLGTHARASVPASGVALLRPQAIAVEASGRRLLAITDSVPLDGTRELRGVELSGGQGGQGFEIVAGLPDSTSSVASGHLGTRLLALGTANDLRVGGGVEQRRGITAFDPSDAEITLASPFSPLPTTTLRWRIPAHTSLVPSSPAGETRVFVWDSGDLLGGGQVVVRVVPYDAEAGLTTDTGVPREVRAGIDVDPSFVGGPGITNGAASLAIADLNGDGRLDLASANRDQNCVTIHFADATGTLPTAPSQTIQGSPFTPMTFPVHIEALDADGDGDLDLATANTTSNNATVLIQSSPGSFVLTPLALGGLSSPADLAHGDLNADAREDLVIASKGSDAIAVFFQIGGGLFGPSPSLTIAHAQLQDPVAVMLGDVDRDGLVDLVSANEGSDNLTIFRQTAPGVFSTSPAWVLGGPGVTDEPASVAIGDLDGDGRDDLALANRAGNDIAVFLQTTAGSFPPLPSVVLQSASGPLQPEYVTLADVDGDGFTDVVSANGGDDLSVFLYRPLLGSLAVEPMEIQGAGGIDDPQEVRGLDLNSDGRTDFAVASTGGDRIAILLQQGGGRFHPTTPDLQLGSGFSTPGLAAVAVGDLDGDGDFDLATANEVGDTVSIFTQIAPGILNPNQTATLGPVPEMDGSAAIAAGDLDGDGRVDLLCAAKAAGYLVIFRQSAVGAFPASPSLAMGGGALGGPISVALADLNQDGRLDVACANQTSSNVTLFFQGAGGSFGSAPSLTLGSTATTLGPIQVVSGDLDSDGDSDVAVANQGGHKISIFFQTAPGSFPPAPQANLGGPASTPQVNGLAIADLDGDGDLDLACAIRGGNAIGVFWQGSGGVFANAPDLLLSDPGMVAPISVAAGDLDMDGDLDLVAGSAATHRLSALRQVRPGKFESAADHHGGPGQTDAPRSVTILDLDGDGDPDLVAAHPLLERASIFFGSH